MSFKVLPDGSILADTVDEALELQSRIMSPAAPRRTYRPRATTNTAGANVATKAKKDLPGLLTALSDNPMAVIKFLIEVKAGEWIATEAVVKAANITNQALPPVIRSIKTISKKHGYAAEGILERKATMIAGKPTSLYRINPAVHDELFAEIKL